MPSQPVLCQNCGTYNLPNVAVCSGCGKPAGNKTNNALLFGLAALFLVLVPCICCGLIGGKKPTEAPSATSKPSPAASLSPTIQQLAALPSPSPTTNQSGKRTATVISVNANLRRSAEQSGEVLQIVPEYATVEVLQQKNAWFYVRADNQTGWMHGNTIRLVNSLEASATPNFKPANNAKIREPEINNSGATAKCRDGSLSYSAHRRGTCSHHGGVAIWY